MSVFDSRAGTTSGTSRSPTSKSRPRTATTSASGQITDDVICAISESRGVSPSIGLAFINFSTCEAVLCQFVDTQTFARVCHKIKVFSPMQILFASTAADSKLISILHENLKVDKNDISMVSLDRGYWSENAGYEYIKTLALPTDFEALKLSLTGNYFAICCFAAALKFINVEKAQTFAAKSLRIKFESSEGAMMIDLSSITTLELVQNSQNARSKDCLFGFLNHTQTRMGSRLLKNNILQPSTDRAKIEQRWAVVEELSTKEETFYRIREGALKSFVDTDKVLADLVVLPTKNDSFHTEQAINKILLLKSFVAAIKPAFEALQGASSTELGQIRDSGTNSFLDVARQSYTELLGDAKTLVDELQEEVNIPLELKSNSVRHFYIKILANNIDSSRRLPNNFINVCYKSKNRNKFFECQTLALVKINQRINDTHNEILALSDATVENLIQTIWTQLAPLYKISESIALLDLLTSFAFLVTSSPATYTHPEICPGIIAIRLGRHPIREKLQSSSSNQRHIPNDIYATQEHKRFQIITGCNMSGKSTYTRSIALMTIMAQIGCFAPAEHASFPIVHRLFARIATDDCLEGNVSTFAAEMREMAFILRNIDSRSLVIVDELGRGTSTTDGLAIAIAIAEALIQSKAFVWFVTHFRDLPRILAERVGVYNLHMNVDMEDDFSTMKMRYKVSQGYEEQKFYGLALVQLVDLPDKLLDTAVQVSQALHEQNNAKRSNTRTLLLARKRKLAVHMMETLIQARDGPLNGRELLDALKALQAEFATRMIAIDEELEALQITKKSKQDRRHECDEVTLTPPPYTVEIPSPRSEERNPSLSSIEEFEDMDQVPSEIFPMEGMKPEFEISSDGTEMVIDQFQSVPAEEKQDVEIEQRLKTESER